MRFAPIFAAAALSLLILSLLVGVACAEVGGFQCPDGMDSFTEYNVYFGLEKGDRSSVTDDEWSTFLADTVTPRFPDGLTVVDARGQWFDTESGRLFRESTKLLNVLVPEENADEGIASIREISDAYKERFDQQAAFHTALPACAEVY